MTEPTDVFAAMNDDFGSDVDHRAHRPRRQRRGAHRRRALERSTGPSDLPAARRAVRRRQPALASSTTTRLPTGVPMLTRAGHRARGRAGRSARLPRTRRTSASRRGRSARRSPRSVPDATFTSTAAAFGGDYARQRTDCRLVGRGATGRLRAVYFGEDEQMLDFRTFQDHAAPDTTSNLLFKGAVGGTQPQRLHRPHPGAEERPGHQRLPDQPQHQAVGRRVGRVRSEPRDREQRRALQPRIGRRSDRRGPALLSREPRRADADRRAARRHRLLRRGAVAGCPVPAPRRLHCATSSPASSTARFRCACQRQHMSRPRGLHGRRAAAGDRSPGRRRRPSHRGHPLRRRRLCHRRPVHARRRLAVRGRGACATNARSSAGSTAARSRS